MFRRPHVRLLPAFLLILALILPTTGLAATPASSDGQLQTVIVGLELGNRLPESVAAELANSLGGKTGFVYSHAFLGFSMELPARAIPALERDPRIAFVEVDQMVQAVEIPTGVQRIEADQYHQQQAGDSGQPFAVDVDVAIIDTGIASHPDLNIVGNVDCTSTYYGSARCAVRGNSDGNGHGTHVAGTVGAKSGGGVVGVAPGARLWSVKVLGSNGSGSMSSIIAGIDWVTARADTIKVANMSLGCECNSTALDRAIDNSTNAGVVYVVAAGNNAKNASTFSPAKHPRVIAVSAIADFDGQAGGLGAPTCRSDVDDTLADFSNFGSVVDIAAPGVCINSTWPGGGYATLSGTSMASPHVAGAAALYIAANNVPKSSSRWSTVLNGFQSASWSIAQTDLCGFSAGLSAERSLMLGDCNAVPPDEELPGDEDPPVNALPTAHIVNPSGGTVAGSVTVQVSASDTEDAAGALSVEVQIGAAAWQPAAFNAGSGNYELNWDSTAVANGLVTINARATDSASGVANAGPVSVTVENVVAPPPALDTLHVESLSGSSSRYSSAYWRAMVTIRIENAAGNAVSNATVSGRWNTGARTSCRTNSAGTCRVSLSRLRYRTVSSVTFEVTGVSHSTLSYAAEDNAMSSIVVNR